MHYNPCVSQFAMPASDKPERFDLLKHSRLYHTDNGARTQPRTLKAMTPRARASHRTQGVASKYSFRSGDLNTLETRTHLSISFARWHAFPRTLSQKTLAHTHTHTIAGTLNRCASARPLVIIGRISSADESSSVISVRNVYDKVGCTSVRCTRPKCCRALLCASNV